MVIGFKKQINKKNKKVKSEYFLAANILGLSYKVKISVLFVFKHRR